jgi:hypothetical protein
MKQQLNEIKRMQQLAGILTESQLNEAKVDMWTIQDVLKNKHVEGKPSSQADLRVGLDYMVPKKFYGSMEEIRQVVGKITKIEGGKVFIEDLKGKESKYDIDDMMHIYNLGA